MPADGGEKQTGGEQKKTDTQILFPEMEVLGYKVNPWKLGQVIDLAPVLQEVKRIVQEQEVTLSNLDSRWLDLLPMLLPYASRIITVSTGMPEEEARDLQLDEAGYMLISILAQNWEYLKNSLGLGLARFKTTAAA